MRKLPELSTLVAQLAKIVKRFDKKLYSDGLATLREYQMNLHGRGVALKRPCTTRWNAIIDSATPAEQYTFALTRTINDRKYRRDKENADEMRLDIIDADGSFWKQLELLVRVLAPLLLVSKIAVRHSKHAWRRPCPVDPHPLRSRGVERVQLRTQRDT